MLARLLVLSLLLLSVVACSQQDPVTIVHLATAGPTQTASPVPTETPTPTITPTATNTPTPAPERFVSVFLGGDEDPLRPERNQYGVRSDVFVIAVMDIPWEGTGLPVEISLIALPRDLWIAVPCSPLDPLLEGHDRVNAAFAYGQAECVRETIAANFPFEVNAPVFYVNFDGFISLIDRMGGLTVTATTTHTEWCGNYHGTDGDEGQWRTWTEGRAYDMDGPQALCYARGRSGFAPDGYPGDLDRNRRALEIMMAMFSQFPNRIFDTENVLDMANELIGVWTWADEYVESDMTIQHIIDLGPEIPRIRDAELRFIRLQHRVQVEFWTTPLYGASVVVPIVDLYAWTECMLLQGEPDTALQAQICTERTLLPDELRWDKRNFEG